ncbi:MAG: efflux RND transporter permease subunit [Pseudomonadota bacterium]|nr:efflux RND transporter permease subunit [Pseudomonadota bacterium]
MNFSEFFIKKPVFCLVFALFLIILGILSLKKLPLRQFPDIERSEITIDTLYPGAASNIVETKITEIIEGQISGIDGIESISSVSKDGKSKITIEFKPDKEINEAANDVRDAVSRILENLPKDSDSPEISKIDSDSNAIMWLNLTSDDINQLELTDYAERYLVDRLSVIPGVAKVRISGGKKKSLRIWVDPILLSQYGVSVIDIEKKLLEENVEIPAGRLESKYRDFTVKLQSGYKSVDDFKDLVLKKGNDFSFVRLGDLAKIEIGPEESRQLFRGNAEEMIGLGILKQKSANLIEVTNRVKDEFKEIKKDLPNNINIYQSYDTSLFVSEALNEVIFTLCFAVILVTIIILLFLKNFKSTLIPLLTVPISILSTFIFLNYFGYSLNLITLLALVLCTGLVIDDSIVMLENIHKKIEVGSSRLNAAINGSKEVFFAIISTSIVLISIFIPIVFLDGDTAKLFQELAVTVIGAVFFSTIISLTLTPMLCSRILNKPRKIKRLRKLEDVYINTLEFLLRKKIIYYILIVPIIFLSIELYKRISKEFAPQEDRGVFIMVMESPEGSTFANTVDQMLKIEEKLIEFNKNNEAKRILLRVPRSFSGTESFSDGLGIIVLNHWSKRRKIWEIIDEFKDIASEITDSKIIIFPPRGLGQRRSGQQLQYVISGDTYENIYRNMKIILEEIEKNNNFLFTRIDYKKNRPQLKVKIDKNKTSNLLISNFEIGRTLEILLAGRKINTFIDNGEEYDVIIQAKKESRKNIRDISAFEVKSNNGSLIRLDNLLKFEEVAEAKELNRYNKMRSITLSAGLKKDYSLGDAISYLEKISNEKLLGTYKIDFKGQSKEYKKSMSQFYFLFFVSLIFVYLILCAQFESFRFPFIIMLSVPLTLLSPLSAIFIFENSLNIFSQIGLIILMGIAAKNGILIVEFAKQLKISGENSYNSLIKACRTRFRPIIMTGVSTVIGIVPLVLGSGAGYESRLTIGIILISGIIFSIFLTLFITPFFFKVFDKN